MKEGFIFGLMVGAFAGMIAYRYNKDVQKIADKGEKIVKEEIEMMKDEAKKIKEEIKPEKKKKNNNSNKNK